MTSWRIDLTVLTDLSASMFAACFMILLIFLGLAQRADPPPTIEAPIEATEALRIVAYTVPSSGETVEALRNHGQAADGVAIDLFADRVEVAHRGQRVALQAQEVAEGLPAAVPRGAAFIRLYVFSNSLYNRVLPALDPSAARIEVSVPRALRDPDNPDGAWSAPFLALAAKSLPPQPFRSELAKLLAGGAGSEPPKGGGAAGTPPSGGSFSGLLDRVTAWLGWLAAIAFPTAGFVAVILIERRRFSSEL